jgi:hypothetical protein
MTEALKDARKGVWVKWKQVHHGPATIFWQFQKGDVRNAKKEEREYNQFGNPHDNIKILAVSKKRPEGDVDAYGNIIPKGSK